MPFDGILIFVNVVSNASYAELTQESAFDGRICNCGVCLCVCFLNCLNDGFSFSRDASYAELCLALTSAGRTSTPKSMERLFPASWSCRLRIPSGPRCVANSCATCMARGQPRSVGSRNAARCWCVWDLPRASDIQRILPPRAWHLVLRPLGRSHLGRPADSLG